MNGRKEMRSSRAKASVIDRKLVAILAADVVGYSTLMERDEGGTFERLKADRKELFEPEIALHRGRIQDAVTIDGETRDYAGRFFCSRCGSSVFARTADEIEVNLGSLDAPDQLMPTYALDRPSQILVAAVSAHETIRPRS